MGNEGNSGVLTQFPCRNRDTNGTCIFKDIGSGDPICTNSEPCPDADPPWGTGATRLMLGPKDHPAIHAESDNCCPVVPACQCVGWRERSE